MGIKSLIVYLARYPLYPGFISGGERHFIEVARRATAEGANTEVLTCPVGEKVLPRGIAATAWRLPNRLWWPRKVTPQGLACHFFVMEQR